MSAKYRTTVGSLMSFGDPDSIIANHLRERTTMIMAAYAGVYWHNAGVHLRRVTHPDKRGLFLPPGGVP